MADWFHTARIGSSFASLPPDFYTQVKPRALTDPRLLHVNPQVAALLGMDASDLASPEFLSLCSGARLLAENVPALATVYSGHQFGIWAGQLGDGRAHLLGDVTTAGGTWEIQLKGSGRTPYSRMGDGWAVLRSSIREYLASEAMAGLGIPTTRALALVASDDRVMRETPETAAIVTRVAPSFVRFGHFEHWARSHHDQKALLGYVVDRFYPECRVGSRDTPDVPATALAWLSALVQRTARLLAQWQLVGFCHGVMNTDNMSVLGLTLDYGPYGFMDGFSAGHICNHSDTYGRYAWNAQPGVASWNLYRLAESLQVLGCEIPALESCLQPFESEFLRAYHDGLARKLGLPGWDADDTALTDDWWTLLNLQHADFTLAFRRLPLKGEDPQRWLALFQDPVAASAWLERYHARLARSGVDAASQRLSMDRANPLYVLRNHLAQEAIEAAQQGDASVLARLFGVLQAPYQPHPGCDHLAQPPQTDSPVVAVSCSS